MKKSRIIFQKDSAEKKFGQKFGGGACVLSSGEVLIFPKEDKMGRIKGETPQTTARRNLIK